MFRAVMLAIGCFLVILGIESLMIDSVLLRSEFLPESLLPENESENTLIAYTPSMMVTIVLFFVGTAVIYQLGLKRSRHTSHSTVARTTVTQQVVSPTTAASPTPLSQPKPTVTESAYDSTDYLSDEDDDEDDDDWTSSYDDAVTADELMSSLNDQFDIDAMIREAG